MGLSVSIIPVPSWSTPNRTHLSPEKELKEQATILSTLESSHKSCVQRIEDIKKAKLSGWESQVAALERTSAEEFKQIELIRRSVSVVKDFLFFPPLPKECEDLRKQIQLIQKIAAGLGKASSLKDAQQVFEKIKRLPEDCRHALYADTLKYHPTAPPQPEPDWGEKTLHKDPRLAMTLRDASSRTLLKVQETTLCRQLESNYGKFLPYYLAQADEFESKLQNLKQDHRVLSKIYQSLPWETQELILKKPPYYGKGIESKLHKTLGAHLLYDEQGKTLGVEFAVMAPHAQKVELAIRNKQGICLIPLDKEEAAGTWHVSVPDLKENTPYYYVVTAADGSVKKKIDPMGFGFIPGPEQEIPLENIVRSTHFTWEDHTWMKERTIPISPQFQELDLTQYKTQSGKILSWKEILPQVIEEKNRKHFTHLQLVSMMDYSKYQRDGRQVLGFFAPDHRRGSLADFQSFVNQLHKANIGVVADWVPFDFAIDSCGLCQYDGTHLIETEQTSGNTPEFDFSRAYVRNLAYSSARFWFEKCHLDGLYVKGDAAGHLFHFDYGKTEKDKNELPLNHKGTYRNLDAAYFLRNLSAMVHKEKDLQGAFLVVGDSPGVPALTLPVDQKDSEGNRGLGFDIQRGSTSSKLATTAGDK